MKSAVEAYRMRRAQRLKARMDADDDGEWRMTKEGNRILIKDGAVVGGNPFVLAVMGKPDKAEMPKKSVPVKNNCPYKLTKENREGLGKALSSRKDKNCIFGGFYKVSETRSATLTTATFFNPYTGEQFGETTSDRGDSRWDEDLFMRELDDISINKEAQWLWNRSNGVIQAGDKVRVVKGRTLAHGTEANVKSIRDLKNDYGQVIATYAYLDNGDKISVKNIQIVEDGKLVDNGSVTAKVAGKGSRKKTITLSKSEQEYFKDVASRLSDDIKKGDTRGVRAKAKNFLKGMELEITKDGKTSSYTYDTVEALVNKIGDSKNVTVKVML